MNAGSAAIAKSLDLSHGPKAKDVLDTIAGEAAAMESEAVLQGDHSATSPWHCWESWDGSDAWRLGGILSGASARKADCHGASHHTWDQVLASMLEV
eukprot:508769-Amphidinium_carterae.1